MSKVEVGCKVCEKKFLTYPSKLKAGRGKYCSNECRHQARSEQLKGKNSDFWRGGKVKLSCAECGTPFEAAKSRKKARYCSHKCASKGKKGVHAGENNPMWRGGPVEVCCQVCGDSFSVNRAKVKASARYCSQDCKSKSQLVEKVLLQCVICNSDFERYPSYIAKAEARGDSVSTCSKKCFGETVSKRQQGEANPQWRGGVTPENKRIRDSKQTAMWRKAVFSRDGYQCRHCGAKNTKGLGKSVKLHAHHIKGFAKYPDLRFNVDNGITLCIECHMAVHFRKKAEPS